MFCVKNQIEQKIIEKSLPPHHHLAIPCHHYGELDGELHKIPIKGVEFHPFSHTYFHFFSPSLQKLSLPEVFKVLVNFVAHFRDKYPSVQVKDSR